MQLLSAVVESERKRQGECWGVVDVVISALAVSVPVLLVAYSKPRGGVSQ